MFLELNSKGLYQSSGNEKKVVVPVLDKKCEIRDFYVVVMQRQQNMTVQKERGVRTNLLLCQY